MMTKRKTNYPQGGDNLSVDDLSEPETSIDKLMEDDEDDEDEDEDDEDEDVDD